MKGKRMLLPFLLLTAFVLPVEAASELPSRLPAMGTVWAMLPILAVVGILLAVIGWKRHTKGDQNGTD